MPTPSLAAKRPGMKRRVAVLASGRGSNLGALLAAMADPMFPAQPAAVVSNQPGAGALELARAAGVPALCIDHRPFGRDRAGHEQAVDAALQEHGAEIVCLAGYMRLLTPWLVERWAGRMLNIHPSLLPAFPGLHTHERVLSAGARLHGCTVHLVTAVMDEGPILAQAAVPVLPGDDPATLAARVLVQEHRLYPAALAAFVRGVPGQSPAADAALLNPLPAARVGPRSPLTETLRAGLRRATSADVAAVRDLTRAAYAKWVPFLQREPKPMTADYEAAVRDHVVDVLHLDGEMAALIEMQPEADHLLIVNVAVSPDCQGRGYGRALLAHAEEFALSLGLREMRLYTSVHLTDNVKLYERVGYKTDRKEEASPHLGVFVYMSKRLVS